VHQVQEGADAEVGFHLGSFGGVERTGLVPGEQLADAVQVAALEADVIQASAAATGKLSSSGRISRERIDVSLGGGAGVADAMRPLRR
jgi:hypothetical protein